MESIAVLGSTGSIGNSALSVVRSLPGKFRILALSTNSNVEALYQQAREFHPEFICLGTAQAGRILEKRFSKRPKVFFAEDGLERIIQDKRIKKIILAISGSAALLPLLKAIDCGKDICLANKEALVMAGPIITNKAKAKKVKLIPIDSEQSAIWQCLEGQERGKLKNIYLTASGGPFRNTKTKDLKNISIERVLKHPRWRMGKKISVDSATLMNKGLELLEAMHLFNQPPEKIKILIHPEAIIHSMVEFIDGVVMAQLSATDMRIPIQYALTFPRRLSSKAGGIEFYKIGSLNFEKPDFKKFPCLGLAYQAAKEGGTMPCVLNAANEISVEEFLKGRISFLSIPLIIEKVLAKHKKINTPNLKEILAADSWAKRKAKEVTQCFH